jgi:hypothetical protein
VQRPAPDQVPVPRARACAAHRVVEQNACAEIAALPDAVLQRVDELHRPDQVGAEPAQHQGALAQRLLHQREVELLEVAQPAVDQLARAARPARRVVAHLDEGDGQPAGRRVKRYAAAGNAAPHDDDDVEALL